MRGPRSLQDFCRLTGRGAEEVEEFRAAGLLDPDGDGRFDDDDVLRLRYVKLFRERGLTTGEIAQGIRDRTLEIPFFGDLLYPAGGRTYTDEEVAELTGLRTDQIRDFRSAVGVGGTLHSREDVDAFQRAKMMIDAGMPYEAFVEGTRVFADSLRRIAETEIRLMHTHLHDRMVEAGVSESEISEQMESVVGALQPIIDPLIRYLHGVFLMRAAADDVLFHLEMEKGRTEREATIAFVDLTGFTTLAELQGDQVASDVVYRFDGIIRDLLVEHNGTLVKQIGDASMLTFSDPADAVRFASALDEAATRQEGFPSIRAGIHHGPVAFRVGDYVGNTVNVASRIAAAAMPNEIVLTRPVADACLQQGIAVEEAGLRLVRGLGEPLALFRVVHQRPGTVDPVCGRTIHGAAAARLTQEGVEIAFCSQDCLRKYVERSTATAT